MNIQSRKELPAWREPVELEPSDTTFYDSYHRFESPAGHQPKVSGASIRQSNSTQDMKLRLGDMDSSMPLLDARAASQSLIVKGPVTVNGTAQSPPATKSLSSMTPSFLEEKEVAHTPNFGPSRGQRALTSLNYSSFYRDHDNTLNFRSGDDEFAQAVNGLNVDWTITLSSVFPPSIVSTYFATPSPLESGIEAWQRCFRGSTPRNLTAVLSIVRISFAVASLLHHDDKSYSWALFYQDVLRWGDTIAVSWEKEVFREAADRLLSPPTWPLETYPQIRHGCVYWVAFSHGEMEPGRASSSTLPSQGLAYHERVMRSVSNKPTTFLQSYSSSMHGPVFAACTQYIEC